jgi:hypothetical protein
MKRGSVITLELAARAAGGWCRADAAELTGQLPRRTVPLAAS